MERLKIINKVIEKLEVENYLEIGVFKGNLFDAVRAKRKTGVDPNFLIPRKKRIVNSFVSAGKIKYYEQKSDDFFKSIEEKGKRINLDVAFVDGLHTWEQAYKDVDNCLRHLNQNGVIIMHDCIPPHAAAAYPAGNYDEAMNLNLSGWSGEWTGDVWKAVVQLRCNSQLETFVLDTDYGIGVVLKAPNSKKLNYKVEEIEAMDYDFLLQNKSHLLNIRGMDYLDEILRR